MFRTISGIFEKFKVFQFFACSVCRGGGVYMFDSFLSFLCSDVNDAVFLFLIVPDTFSSFCKIFKISQFLHVECEGGGVLTGNVLGLYRTCMYWLRWFRGIVDRSLVHHLNR